MGPMKLYFDVRDIFRAPRLALSGKKILIFMVGNLIGFIAYWILTYLAFALAGHSFADTWSARGLYPCLFGSQAPWYAWLVFGIGVLVWFYTICLACTAVSRVTYKQLKGDEFYSSGDAWKFVKKHWHSVIFTSLSIVLILVFFVFMAGIFTLFGKIPFVGEFLFSIPYLFYFFGSVFTVYTIVVLLISAIYTPSIISAYEEDTMGAVFQSYSLTWSQPWRIVLYHLVLLPIGYVAIQVLRFFWMGGYNLINIVFGHEWTLGMGLKLERIVGWATDLVNPALFFKTASAYCQSTWEQICAPFYSLSSLPEGVVLSGTELVSGVILSIFLFLLIISVLSYGLSILSVGETLMFVIFKKKSDDENLLERKDEEELEEEKEEETSDLKSEDEEAESSDQEAEEKGGEDTPSGNN